MFYEIEHTADLALHIEADNYPDLLENAATGMFYLIFRDSLPSNTQKISKTYVVNFKNYFFKPIENYVLSEVLSNYENFLEYFDYESFLIDWLNELLFLFSEENLIFSTIESISEDSVNYSAIIADEKMDVLSSIKAATFHNLQIKKNNHNLTCEIIFDI